MQKENQAVLEWLGSEGFYKENLWVYFAIICFWVALGFFTLGFEVPDYNLQQNLLFNFLYFLLLCIAILLTPFWYAVFFTSSATRENLEKRLLLAICLIEDKKLANEVEEYLVAGGGLPSRKYKKMALFYLGCYILSELFLITSLIKNGELIWRAEWVDAIINWVIRNTETLEDSNNKWKLFSFYLPNSEVKDYFSTGQEFLASFLGRSMALLIFWRCINYIPIIICMIILFNKSIIDFANIDQDYLVTIKSLVGRIFILPFMLIFLFSSSYAHISFLRLDTIGKLVWLSNFWMNISFIFTFFGFLFFIDFYLFIKSCVISIMVCKNQE